MRCNNCGIENQDGARFCRSCGRPLTNKKKTRVPLVLGVLGGLLVILVAVGIVCAMALSGRAVMGSGDVGDEVDRKGTVGVAGLAERGIEASDEAGVRRAVELLESELGLGNISGQLGECRVDKVLGRTYYRFEQMVSDYAVYGRSLVVCVNEEGVVDAVSGNVAEVVGDVGDAAMSRIEAEDRIVEYAGGDSEVSPAELVLYPCEDGKVTLCYQSLVSSEEGVADFFVSATDGEFVGQEQKSFTEQVEGTGETNTGEKDVHFMTERVADNEFHLYDSARDITVYDAKYGYLTKYLAYEDQMGNQYRYDLDKEQLISLTDGSTRDLGKDCRFIGLYLSTYGIIGSIAVVTSSSTNWSNKPAVTAMHNVALVGDFYAEKLKRSGFSNGPIHDMSVCINTLNQTAAWGGSTKESAIINFKYDDTIALDTAAHEFTHCVEQSICKMKYKGESGAIMEATSDVFGELVEDCWDDGTMNNSCNWVQSNLRNLASPERSPRKERNTGNNPKAAHPSRYRQDGYWASTTPDENNDHGYVHNNSTVISHAAYLMCNGLKADKDSLLTTEELASVMYSTFYDLHPNCSFSEYAGWFLYEAQLKLTELKVMRAKAAFEAVNVIPSIVRKKTEQIDVTDPKKNTGNTTARARDIALVLDVSGSMAGEPLEATKEAAKSFVDIAASEDARVGVVTFSDNSEVLAPIDVSASTAKLAIDGLTDRGGTNMEAGLVSGDGLLGADTQNKRIIVLMSDGEPNKGKTGNDLIAYAQSLRDANADGKEELKIYAVGFDESASGQELLASIASPGCHYEVKDASDLEAFFADIADEINGTRFIYARVACPVDVTVTFNGETLSSSGDHPQTRTSFGSLSFEEEQTDSGSSSDTVKVLRLREGESYDISIEGYDTGVMDYSIGFLDAEGDYSDFRTFSNVEVSKDTLINTKAEVSDKTQMDIDEDGDGRADRHLVAGPNEEAQPIDNGWVVRVVFAVFALTGLCIVSLVLFLVYRSRKNRGFAR